MICTRMDPLSHQAQPPAWDPLYHPLVIRHVAGRWIISGIFDLSSFHKKNETHSVGNYLNYYLFDPSLWTMRKFSARRTLATSPLSIKIIIIIIIIQTQLHRTPRPPNSTIFYRRHDVRRSYDVVWFLTTTTVSNRCQGLSSWPYVVCPRGSSLRHGSSLFPAFCGDKTRSEIPSSDQLPTPLSCYHGTAAFFSLLATIITQNKHNLL
jgi:hypothetical protein